jgi:excisionase family DNA binding protein
MKTNVIGKHVQQCTGSRSQEQPRLAAYTVAEVAALLGLSPGSTYALVRRGSIPARRMSRGQWIVPKRCFHRWLEGWSS